MPRPSSAFVSRRIPLYYQLENLLREKILSGTFAAGGRLPTESELIQQYGISRITVRQALTSLADEGLIERRQGRGTFVAERRTPRRRFEGTIHLTGSLDELIAMAQDTPVKVLEMNRIEADPHEAELLGIEPGEPIFRFKRLRLREGTPYSVIVNYFPAEIGARFTREELSSGSISRILETKFGLRLSEARQQITATLADPHIAGLLEIPVGSALLSIERSVYTDTGRLVEFVRVLYRTDLYSYSVLLTRDPDVLAAAARAKPRLVASAPARDTTRRARGRAKQRG